MGTNLLTVAMQDDVTAAKLVEIASKHVKLALEHGHRNTPSERREAIKDEIQRLRVERDKLLMVLE